MAATTSECSAAHKLQTTYFRECGVDPGLAIGLDLDRVALTLEIAPDEVGGLGIVFDDEDVLGHRLRIAARRGAISL